MRKRSKYRPRAVIADPLAYVVNGFLPLREASNEVMRLRTINHRALERIVKGKGERQDGINLSNAFITTASLAEIGTGIDWLQEIEEAQQAVNALLLRGHKTGRHVFTGPELTTVNLAMKIHDLQIDNCTIEKFERAIVRAKQAATCGYER